jgi:hypothetical protein
VELKSSGLDLHRVAIPAEKFLERSSLYYLHSICYNWKMRKEEMMIESIEDILNRSKKRSPNQIGAIDESSDPEIKEPFDPTKIDVNTKYFTIDLLIKRMKANPPRIDLNTEFQRKGNLWDETAQSRLIESLLVRIPIPAFYFDGTNDDKWLVVDGLQRLNTLKRFVIDKSFKLSNLEFLNRYNGHGFDSLPAYLQGRIEETQIIVFIIRPGTPGEVKFNIFKRINTVGIVLNSQEIRHALNQGIPANFVKELAELPEFNQATHNKLKNSDRMEDRDYVTRFIAFYNGYKDYKSDLDTYLHDSMGRLKNLTDGQRERIKLDFIKGMKAAFELFGKYAFRKILKKNDRTNPLNKALFETVSVNLAQLSDEELELLISKKDVLNRKFIKLMNTNSEFVSSISTGTGKLKAVKVRFDTFEELLKELVK